MQGGEYDETTRQLRLLGIACKLRNRAHGHRPVHCLLLRHPCPWLAVGVMVLLGRVPGPGGCDRWGPYRVGAIPHQKALDPSREAAPSRLRSELPNNLAKGEPTCLAHGSRGCGSCRRRSSCAVRELIPPYSRPRGSRSWR